MLIAEPPGFESRFAPNPSDPPPIISPLDDVGTVECAPGLGGSPNNIRRVIEIKPDSNTQAIQKTVDKSAKFRGQRPVVHLEAGSYSIDFTITIPTRLDLQLIGDRILNATQVLCRGTEEGAVLKFEGPSRAMLRDLHITGGKAGVGIMIENCEQPGGRVFMEQVQVASTTEVGLQVEGVKRSRVELHDIGHSGARLAVRVHRARVFIFSGASSNNHLSYEVTGDGELLARGIWYESGQYLGFLRLTDSGNFTLHGAQVAVFGSEEVPAFQIDGFRGKVAIISADIVSTNAKIPPKLVVNAPGQSLLVIGSLFGRGYIVENRTSKRFAFAIKQGRFLSRSVARRQTSSALCMS